MSQVYSVILNQVDERHFSNVSPLDQFIHHINLTMDNPCDDIVNLSPIRKLMTADTSSDRDCRQFLFHVLTFHIESKLHFYLTFNLLMFQSLTVSKWVWKFENHDTCKHMPQYNPIKVLGSKFSVLFWCEWNWILDQIAIVVLTHCFTRCYMKCKCSSQSLVYNYLC